MSDNIEDRIVTINKDGKDYIGEVRQYNERVSCVVWVPSIKETITVSYADDAGRPGFYQNEDGTHLTYHFKSWSNSGTQWTKVRSPKKTVTT